MDAGDNYIEEYDGDGYNAYDSAGAFDDLADDLHDLLMQQQQQQQQHISLLELPAPCLQRLIALLPRHRSNVLRQCSRALQQQVDAVRGIALVLDDNSSDAQHAAALSVSAASLTSLSTCSISATAKLQQLLQAVQAAAGGLPQLEELRCDIDHLEVLNAVAALSPQLSSITLFSKRDQAELLAMLDHPLHEELYVDLLQEQLPGLKSLRSLQLRGYAMVLPLKSACIARTIGALTQLRSLTLDHHFPNRQLEVDQTCWIRMLAPLTELTRLAIVGHGLSGIIVTSQHLSALQSLVCQGFTDQQFGAVPGDDSKWYNWVAQRSQLTHLKLVASPEQISGTLLSKLQSLRSLTLEYTTADYEFISSNALLPLAACSQLTYLAVDSLTVEAPAAGSAQRQLTSLRSLAIGVNGVADYRVPLSTFAPYLTALTDVFTDWPPEWGDSATPVQISTGIDALKGLQQLQLLVLDVAALDYHVTNSSLTELTGLRELQIMLTANQPIQQTANLSGKGLPFMPYLTKLVLEGGLQSDELEVPGLSVYCLRHTYPESLLLWQHQSNLRCLQLKDSVSLGGFMTNDALLAQLPQKLPQLQCIELDRCRNLGLLPLAKLVGSRAAGKVLVRSWKHVTSSDGVSEQTCLALELSSGGAVQVEYCW